MKNFNSPLPSSVSASVDTFAADINKIVDALTEIRSAVPAVPGDLGSITTAQYTAILNRVATLENAVTQLEAAPVNTPPSAPSITGVTSGDGTATVYFNAPASNGGQPITKYVATTSTGKMVEGTSSPIIITGLKNGEPITISVAAVNSLGVGANSAQSAGVVPAAVSKPSAVTNLQYIAGNSIVTLSWQVPASDGGSAVTGYRITRDGTTTVDVASTQRTYTVSGLTNGQSYGFAVGAINANGAGPVTNITATPASMNAEARKVDLLGIATGLASKLPVNSGVNPAGRSGRYDGPDGYEYLNGIIASQRGVPFDIRTGYQYNNRNVSEGSTAWNDLKGMQVLDWFDSAYPAVLGMPMFPTGGSYAAAANGSYDAQYIAIGQTIKSKRPAGTGKVILRLDWEFNYGTRASQNLTNWNNAWRRAVTKIREGAGDRVKFSWSIAANTSDLATLKGMYPGNDYVDVIGIDTYDAFLQNNTTRGYRDETTWLKQTGIGEVFTWAKSNEKLVGLDEWGGHATGQYNDGMDNADWPRIVLEWCRKNADWVAYELSFNDTAAGNVANNLWNYNSISVQLPNQRTAYIAKIKSMVLGSPEARDLLTKGVDKPDATNTGVYAGTTFTITSSHTPVSGTTYRDLDIRNSVNLGNKANVTYINCIFRGASANPTTASSLVRAFNPHSGGHKFIDCTFKTQVPHFNWNGIQGYGFTLIRCNFSDVTDAVQIFNNNNGPAGTGDNSLRNGPVNVVIEQSYFHDLAWFSGTVDTGAGAIGSHSDDIQYQGGTNVSIVGNTFTGMIGESYGPNAYGTYTSNATMLIKPDVGLISDVTIDRNWIDGGSFSINMANDAPDRYITSFGSITNNKFGRNQRVQSSTPDTSYTIAMPSTVTGTFTGNIYEDNGNPILVRRNQ